MQKVLSLVEQVVDVPWSNEDKSCPGFMELLILAKRCFLSFTRYHTQI